MQISKFLGHQPFIIWRVTTPYCPCPLLPHSPFNAVMASYALLPTSLLASMHGCLDENQPFLFSFSTCLKPCWLISLFKVQTIKLSTSPLLNVANQGWIQSLTLGGHLIPLVFFSCKVLNTTLCYRKCYRLGEGMTPILHNPTKSTPLAYQSKPG